MALSATRKKPSFKAAAEPVKDEGGKIIRLVVGGTTLRIGDEVDIFGERASVTGFEEYRSSPNMTPKDMAKGIKLYHVVINRSPWRVNPTAAKPIAKENK